MNSRSELKTRIGSMIIKRFNSKAITGEYDLFLIVIKDCNRKYTRKQRETFNSQIMIEIKNKFSIR